MAGRHRRAKRPSPVDSSSVGYGTQGVDSWSQPLQNAGNDDRTSYPNAWINDVQRPNETPSTHWGWDRERTERPLYLSVSGEQDATNAQPGGYRPVMQQAMPSHYAEKIIDSGLLPDTRTQHRVGTSNTVEAQRHWNGQNDTQDGESSFESTRNDTSRLEPWPHSQHAIGNPLQGHERDPNFSSSSGFTTGHRPMHDADRSHELLGMSPMLTTQDFGCLGNGGIEFPLNGIDGTQTGANPEPWSFYQPPDMSHLPQQDDRNQNSYLGSISDATLSSFRSDNLESGRQAPLGAQSYITSYDTLNDGMSENIPAQHPGPLYPRIPREGVPNRGPRNPLFTSPIFVFRPATPPIAPSRGALYRSVSDTESSIPGHGLLSPRPESMTSDTHSCVSDTSSPAASSEIYCDVDDCCTAFSGVHRKGNLARHKRLKHSGRVYVCENASCERVFNRQDARLKHYRKYHQQLARPYIARPQTRHANREQYSDFMSNASG